MSTLAPRISAPIRGISDRRRLAYALGALLALHLMVIAAGDSRAYSSADAGGKMASVVAMDQAGSLRPDVGYWAEAADPAGRYHPLFNTFQIGDSWVQTTSVPFSLLALLLWKLGGAPAVLLISVTGALMTAAGARQIARRLGQGEGWAAFWLIGASSSVLFYGADVWEHALGLGVVTLAVAAVLGTETPRGAVLAGLALGASAILRAELVLYAVALVLAVATVTEIRRRWTQRPILLGWLVAAAAVPVVGNQVAERVLLGGGVRDARVSSLSGDAGGFWLTRLDDAVLTSVGLFPVPIAASGAVVGIAMGVGLIVLGRAAAGGRSLSPALTVWASLVTAMFAVRAGWGLGYVPGVALAFPLVGAAAASSVGRGPHEQVVIRAALFALPLVWAAQWRGHHDAQWGGRYILLSGVLLAIVGIGAIGRVGWRSDPARILVALTLAVSGFAVATHVWRTSVVGEAGDALGVSDVVLISTQAHLGRELGWWYGDRPALSAGPENDVSGAVEVARELGVESFDLVERRSDPPPTNPADPPQFTGFVRMQTTIIPYLAAELVVTRYDAR